MIEYEEDPREKFEPEDYNGQQILGIDEEEDYDPYFEDDYGEYDDLRDPYDFDAADEWWEHEEDYDEWEQLCCWEPGYPGPVGECHCRDIDLHARRYELWYWRLWWDIRSAYFRTKTWAQRRRVRYRLLLRKALQKILFWRPSPSPVQPSDDDDLPF